MPAGVSRAADPSSAPVPSAVLDRTTSNTSTPAPHVGAHSRYSAGCRCAACTAAHAGYLADWRGGRILSSADAAPVRAHLQRLVGSGLVLAYLADEAGVPRRTVYGIWHGTRRTAPATAASLLALRPLRVADALPAAVREGDALAASAERTSRRTGVAGLDLHRQSARQVAEQLGVSARTVQRWRAAQAVAGESRSA